MTDTPDTDNLARGNHVVPTEFAQDLERQLRAAIDRLATIADEAFGPFPVQSAEENLTAIEQGIYQLRMDNDKLERERDEAREALSEWENEKRCDECGHPLSQCGDQNDDGEPEMDCFRCRTLFVLKEAKAESARLLERIERERDEAIAARKTSAADWLNQVEQANARVSRALQQPRDFAIREMDRLEEERDQARSLADAAAWEADRLHSQLWRARDRAWKLARQRNHWKADCLEQCKLLAMGADREEKLLHQVAALKSQISNLKSP